jgi:organic hydroperoxide reductase OsmC/OhrA
MPRPRKDYRIELRRSGTLTTERGHPLDLPRAWTPEHLLLAAVARCSLIALDHHARRASLEAGGSGWASGSVDRSPDGAWAFVDVECSLDVSLDPAPSRDVLRGLLDRAERGCFIGSSLTPKPRYHWRVNGEEIR